MRGALLLPVVAVLAGCGGAGPAPLPIGQINAFFPSGGVVDTIDILVLDRLPLRSADLVAPNGRTTAAQSILAQPAASSRISAVLPTTGVTVLGGVGGNPPGAAPVGAGVQSESTLLATLSTATITLPDPTAYRRDWRRYRIRVNLGDPPGVDRREIAAPAPSAADLPVQ